MIASAAPIQLGRSAAEGRRPLGRGACPATAEKPRAPRVLGGPMAATPQEPSRHAAVGTCFFALRGKGLALSLVFGGYLRPGYELAASDTDLEQSRDVPRTLKLLGSRHAGCLRRRRSPISRSSSPIGPFNLFTGAGVYALD
jgi:hypothetical protein